MPSLDLRSLVTMSGVMAVVLGLVLLGVRANFPASIRGLRFWGQAPLLCALSTVLFMLSGVLPAWVLVLGGNGLLMAGFAFFLFGSQRFLGLPVTWRWWSGVSVAALATMGFFFWAVPDYRIRVLIFTSTLALMAGAHARLLWRHGRGFSTCLTAGVLTAQALILMTRGITSLWWDAPQADRFAPSWMQTAYLGAYCFSVLLVCVGVLLMASERVRSEFEHLATHDGLTGALTRRALLALADQEVQRWQRYQQPFSLLMLDIDHFKQINDTHGHLAGDAVLRGVVAQVQCALRSADRLGRYGGEEFLVLMPGTDLAAAQAVAERIAVTVRESPGLAGGPRCTVSIGVTAMQPGDNRFDQLLARADAALYGAKASGRDQVAVAPVNGNPGGISG